MFEGKTKEELIDLVAQDYAYDRGRVEALARQFGDDMTFEDLERVVVDELEDVIAGDDANMEYDFL